MNSIDTKLEGALLVDLQGAAEERGSLAAPLDVRAVR
jgi:hypothetical protein